MTVATSTSKSGPYAGAGTVGPFPVDFRFLENSHLLLTKTTIAAVDSVLVLGADYSVSGAGATTGSVTLVTALATGEKLTITRAVPATQDADYVQNDSFPAESHERALDKLTMLAQQNDEKLSRTLKLPVSVAGVSTDLPGPVANNILAWNQFGTGLQNLNPQALATIVAFGTANADVFTGTGAQKIFTLTANPGTQANLDVAVGGVTQLPGIDYTWTGGTSVTFSTAPPAGVKVLLRYMQALPQGVTDSATATFTPLGTGAVVTNVSAKLRERYSVFDFMSAGEKADALAGTQLLDHTASIQAAINWGVVNGGNLIFPYAKYNVSTLQVKDAVQTFSITMENPIIFGNSASAQAAILEVVNCVQFAIFGTCSLHAQDKTTYTNGFSARAQAGTSAATTRCSFYGITVRNARTAFNVGDYLLDFQCSELNFFGCHSFNCPRALVGGGSQSGANFIGCNLVSEFNAAIVTTLKGAILEGGFWYFSGCELVQTNATAGNLMLEIRPCSSVTYSSPYAIAKVDNSHVESAGILVAVNNTRAIATPYSLPSAVSFSNCSGYINSPGLATIVDSTADNTYAGKLVFNNGTNFYGNLGVNRAAGHIALGTNTVLDLDGTPFGQSFLQGLAGILAASPGKPRLRGETIVAYTGAVTSIASASSTIVNFPTLQTTNDSGYGAINYSAGSYTAPQAMKDVMVTFQVAFATAAAIADVWVAVNGTAVGFFAPFVSNTIRGGSYVIPSLAAGDVVTIRANTNTGASIALTGGVANYLRINAKT